MDWGDIKYFLAIAEEGSLSSAAKKLKVSQPTLSRHLADLEEQLDNSLFIRSSTGLDVTPTGEKLLEHARHMADEVHAITRISASHDVALEGKVTISVIESIGADWLTGELIRFHLRYPNIEIELKIENSAADLLRREADVAIRMFRPTQPDLIAKKVGAIAYGLYATEDYLERHGMPKTPKDISDHNLVLPQDNMLQYLRSEFKARKIHIHKASFRSNSMAALIKATLSGFGIGILSSLTASRFPELIPVLEGQKKYNPLWLVTHEDLNKNARIRAVYDFLSEVTHENKIAFGFEGDSNFVVC